MAGSMRLVPGNSDTWELRVYLGRSSTGKVRHKHRRFKGSERAAERVLARMVTEQEDAPAPVPEAPTKWGPTTTLNDAIEAWKDNGWEDLSEKTVMDYQCAWDRHIRSTIGKKRIATLSTYEIEKFYRRLKDEGRGQHTVRIVRSIIRKACRLARKWSGGKLPNPAVDTELPKWSGPPKTKPRPPTSDEAGRMLAEAESEDIRLAVYVRFAAATGARRGEVCGVRWSDVDWDSCIVEIDEKVVAASGGAIVKRGTKTDTVRSEHLDRDTMASLRKLHEAQQELARFAGVILSPDSFVFSFDPGGTAPPHPDTMTARLAAVRKRAGVPGDVQPIHGWRHFQATELDGVISERQKQVRLGWSTTHPAMSRHYTGPVDAEGRRAAEHMGKVLRKARASVSAGEGSGSSSPSRRSTSRRAK